MRSEHSAFAKPGVLTVTLNHERLDDVMSDHLKVGMADPVADRGLGPSEKVIDNGHFVTQEHQTVDQVRSDETGPPGDQYALAIGWRQEFNGRETREGRVGDRVGVWVENGLGLIQRRTLS